MEPLEPPPRSATGGGTHHGGVIALNDFGYRFCSGSSVTGILVGEKLFRGNKIFSENFGAWNNFF